MLPGEAYEVYTILPRVLDASTCKILPTKTRCPTLATQIFSCKSVTGIPVIPSDLSFKPSKAYLSQSLSLQNACIQQKLVGNMSCFFKRIQCDSKAWIWNILIRRLKAKGSEAGSEERRLSLQNLGVEQPEPAKLTLTVGLRNKCQSELYLNKE